MDKQLIFEIIDKINNTSVSKFEYEDDGFKLKIEKDLKQNSMSKISDIESIQIQEPNCSEISDEKCIKSPIIGTFYESSTPGGEPYITAGKQVKKGDTVCIVEAMKVMNEIESEFDGTVTKILVKNGEIVQYGQPLMTIL